MPDGFLWLTRVPHYDEDGFVSFFNNGLPLWICNECGAVVDECSTALHFSWHERLCLST
jgi:hypothetical protein